MEFDQQPFTIGIGSAGDLLAQARQIPLNDPQVVFDRAPIQCVGRNRFVSEYRAAFRSYLGDTADNKNPPCDGLAFINLYRARPNRRYQWGMTRQHTEIALGAWHHHHLDHFREQEALRSDQFKLHAVGHRLLRPYAASAAIFCALATASSIVPTI